MNASDYLRRKQQRAAVQYLVVPPERDASVTIAARKAKAAFAYRQLTRNKTLDLSGNTFIPAPVPLVLNDPRGPTYYGVKDLESAGQQLCGVSSCGTAQVIIGQQIIVDRDICSQPIADPNPIKSVKSGGGACGCDVAPRFICRLCCRAGNHDDMP